MLSTTMMQTMAKRTLVHQTTTRAAAAAAATTTQSQVRSISIGTDMLSSAISLQTARPWSMTPDLSNMAIDNAVPLKDLFANKRVVLFGVPAPFTGTCTLEHYPGYKRHADELLQSGVDEIVCYAVSDPYSHHGWSQSLENDDSKIRFLADPDASFARAYGVDATYDEASLGLRSKRFSMLVEDGEVHSFYEVSDAVVDAERMLDAVKELNETADAVNVRSAQG